MATEQMTASRTIDAAPEAVFERLADPAAHVAIDGTGWVREALDTEPLTRTGQIFRMAMYHDNHPDKDYEMANRVEVLVAPTAIAWQPGQESAETGELGFGGSTWRYDLVPFGASGTEVTVTYDWSAATPEVRSFIDFPPFPPEHLETSLHHLAKLVE